MVVGVSALEQAVDLGCAVPRHSSGSCLRRHWQPWPSELCRLVWSRIPESYCRGILYSDFFWESYQKVLPDYRHQPVGKKSEGQTSPMWSAGTLHVASAPGRLCEKDAVVLRARRCTRFACCYSCTIQLELLEQRRLSH